MTNLRLAQAVLPHKPFTFLEQKPQQQLSSIQFQWKKNYSLKETKSHQELQPLNPRQEVNLLFNFPFVQLQNKTGWNILCDYSFRQNILSILILSKCQREEFKLPSSNNQHVINTASRTLGKIYNLNASLSKNTFLILSNVMGRCVLINNLLSIEKEKGCFSI